jgi:hypothetical protein
MKKDEMGSNSEGEMRKAYRILVGKPEGEKPVDGSRRR